jgi:cobalt-zinc-cadmium efflux system outer membrane protein
VGLVCVAGCLYPVNGKVDGVVCELALQPRDQQPITHADTTLPAPVEEIKQVAWQEKDDLPPPKSQLTIPDTLLPGGKVPPIKLPPLTPGNEEARKKAIEQLFPPLPALGEDLHPAPGPEGKALTLSDLQRLALANSPIIKQAAARVEEARGAAIQAGLGPNPTVGYESDTSGTTGGAGYVGGFIEQTIKTGNKLQLARAIATMELKNAELALIRAQAELASKVRSGYFAVLVAQESVRLNRALVDFTTDVYKIQVDQVKRGGFVAPYEPMYLRSHAIQARANLVQARNRRTAAWKQLAATLGLPGLPATLLAGRLDVPIPAFVHKDVLARALAGHTDVRTAENTLIQARLKVEFERMLPVPDVNLRVMLQKDRTSPPFLASPSIAVSLPVPVWDRNQGNILQAQAGLARASEEGHRVRTELTTTLAEAFERYENSKVILAYYRDQILPDLVRVYRGVYERYQREPAGPAGTPPAFTDVIVAQQNLAQAIGSYITSLGNLWQAVVDVADVLQTFDLFAVEGAKHPVPEIPDLGKLPCCHPCSPLPGAHQRPVDGDWPAAIPEPNAK